MCAFACVRVFSVVSACASKLGCEYTCESARCYHGVLEKSGDATDKKEKKEKDKKKKDKKEQVPIQTIYFLACL